MPVRIAPIADVTLSTAIVPRSLPNNRPPAMVRPDWSSPPKVARSWRTERRGSLILDQEQRVSRQARPRLAATSMHHGTNDEETGWLWNMLSGSSPQLIIPLLQRAELTSVLDYSWPFVIAADESSGTAAPNYLGGNVTRFPVETTFRRFAAGARVWIYPTSGATANTITLSNRRLPGIILVIVDVQPTYLDVTLDLPASGITFPRAILLAPAFDALPLGEIEGEYPTCGKFQTQIEATEYAGANQQLPLNSGDVSAIYDYFLGDPVWMPDHNWAQKLKINLQRRNEISEMGEGDVVVLYGLNPRFMLEVSCLTTRPRWWDVMELFDSRRGDLRAMWVVTSLSIFDTIEVAAPTDFFSGLPQRGYESHLNAMVDAVAFLRANGTFEIAQVDSFVYDDPSGTLILETVQIIPAGTYIKVLVAYRGRFEENTLEEEWVTCDLVKSEFNLRQLNPESTLSI